MSPKKDEYMRGYGDGFKDRAVASAAKAGEISPYEWLAQEFERLAVLRKMWTPFEVAAIIRRHDIERNPGVISKAEAS